MLYIYFRCLEISNLGNNFVDYFTFNRHSTTKVYLMGCSLLVRNTGVSRQQKSDGFITIESRRGHCIGLRHMEHLLGISLRYLYSQ